MQGPLESRVQELLAELIVHPPDLFRLQACHEQLRGLGVDSIPVVLIHAEKGQSETVAVALREILAGLAVTDHEKACTYLCRALRRDRPLPVRLLALGTLADSLHRLTSYIDWVVPLALDSSEPSDLRARALRTLRKADLPVEHARELGSLLDLAVLGPNCPVPLREALFACLKDHAGKLPVERTMTQLGPFLTHPEPTIRVPALALLGEVGEIDAIEHMCMLPNTAEEIGRIQEAIGRILLRPRNLLSIRWELFEEFVVHLLRKMGHQDVQKRRSVRDDGIDVTSYQGRDNAKGPGRERWAVQCKCWKTKSVDLDVLEALIKASRDQDAKHALLITTSDFTRRALEFARQHTAAIELVSGEELQTMIDRHFGPGRYTIRPRG